MDCLRLQLQMRHHRRRQHLHREQHKVRHYRRCYLEMEKRLAYFQNRREEPYLLMALALRHHRRQSRRLTRHLRRAKGQKFHHHRRLWK